MAQADQLFAENKFAEALDLYSAVVRISPRDAVALRQSAACKVRLGEVGPATEAMPRFRSAEQQLRTALTVATNDARTHMWLARCLGQEAIHVGVWKSVPIGRELKVHVDKAIALDASLDAAYHIRARWHREVSEKPKIARIPLGLAEADLKKGFADIKKAIELNPNHIKHLTELARFYIRMKQPENARDALGRARALPSPDDPENASEAEQLLASLATARK
jgi:Flp pilus assembly protein TadD